MIKNISKIFLYLSLPFNCPIVKAIFVIVKTAKTLFILMLCGFFLKLKFFKHISFRNRQSFFIGIMPQLFFSFLLILLIERKTRNGCTFLNHLDTFISFSFASLVLLEFETINIGSSKCAFLSRKSSDVLCDSSPTLQHCQFN